jgi:hypothetical protein
MIADCGVWWLICVNVLIGGALNEPCNPISLQALK